MIFGLQLLEFFTSAHTEYQTEFMHNLAAMNNLLRTAGSDFHENSELSPRTVGDYQTHGFTTDDIVSVLDKFMLKAKSSL